jgi:hypothetical protein
MLNITGTQFFRLACEQDFEGSLPSSRSGAMGRAGSRSGIRSTRNTREGASCSRRSGRRAWSGRLHVVVRLFFSYTRIVPIRACYVSFTDEHGIRHTAEVTGSSLYEAAALAVGCFRRSGLSPRPTATLTVTLKAPAVARHGLVLERLETWLGRNGKTPKEQALKARLRRLSG